MPTIVCTKCGGKGWVKVGWFRTIVCPLCHGSGHVNKLSTPVRRTEQSDSSQDDGAPALDFTRSDNLSSHTSTIQEDTVVGHGGTSGGAGASGHWGDSRSTPDCENTPPSPDSGPSSCPDSSGGGSGGE